MNFQMYGENTKTIAIPIYRVLATVSCDIHVHVYSTQDTDTLYLGEMSKFSSFCFSVKFVDWLVAMGTRGHTPISTAQSLYLTLEVSEWKFQRVLVHVTHVQYI